VILLFHALYVIGNGLCLLFIEVANRIRVDGFGLVALGEVGDKIFSSHGCFLDCGHFCGGIAFSLGAMTHGTLGFIKSSPVFRGQQYDRGCHEKRYYGQNTNTFHRYIPLLKSKTLPA
jgi:hypothetical protein